jgi:hypothetical protein
MDSETIDRIYAFNSTIVNSPTALLYVMLTDLHEIKGVLWGVVDVIEAVIYVKVFTVDKEYQSNNTLLIEKATDHLLSLTEGSKLKREIRFQATHPDAYEKAGARRSNYILMEMPDDYKNNQKRKKIPDTDELD